MSRDSVFSESILGKLGTSDDEFSSSILGKGADITDEFSRSILGTYGPKDAPEIRAFQKAKEDFEFPDVMAIGHEPPVETKKFYTDTAASSLGVMTPGISSYMGKMGYGPKPACGWSEAGVPLDVEGKPYN